MAAAVTNCAFNLAREMLLQNMESTPEKRTFFATLDSPDRDFRTFVIIDRWCDEFEELNPEIELSTAHIISLITNFKPEVLQK